MKKIALLITCFLFFAMHSQAQNDVPAATVVLKKAIIDASKQNKKVLLIFHASWCGWCHKMDAALNDNACKKFFDDNFVITHITVMESKGKENLENAGGQLLMEKYNGKDQGLPYWAVLDKDANLLFDSQEKVTLEDGSIKGQNIGCPATEKEVEKFITILKKTTSLTAAQLAIIAKRFRQNESK
ncbi:MAG TPA: thioredoxin family protein [Ferruginibacter sp.]|nr:thioredoxin family protein [Ferruginibacter sp.]